MAGVDKGNLSSKASAPSWDQQVGDVSDEETTFRRLARFVGKKGSLGDFNGGRCINVCVAFMRTVGTGNIHALWTDHCECRGSTRTQKSCCILIMALQVSMICVLCVEKPYQKTK